MLMVTYGFPPKGGGGIQRNVKFLKYLSRLGWDLDVLTVKETDFYVYDNSMLNQIRENVSIHRADSVDPLSLSSKVKKLLKGNKQGNAKAASGTTEGAWYVSLYRKIRDLILLPDAYGGWIPFAYYLGKKVVEEQRPDVIFGSFPGPSNAIVAYKLAKKFNIPYILDFRDGWLDDPYIPYPTLLHRKFHAHYEKKIVEGADKIIVYAEILKTIFEQRYPSLKGKIDTITNGFDPEDFDNLIPAPRSDKKRIVYSGAVYIDRRNNMIAFLEAMAKLDPALREKLEVIFVGVKHQWAVDIIKEKGLQDFIHFTGYVPHKEALNYLASADAALLFLAKGDVVAITGKVFEYLGLGKPVIACVEKEGACSRLLRSINHDQGVCDPTDSDSIAAKISEFCTHGLPELSAEDITAFSRKHHSYRLNNILNEIISVKEVVS